MLFMGVIEYVRETKAEMKHVTWPSRSQVAIFTLAVIALSVVVALYLGFFDFIFSRALESALSGRGSTPTEQIDDTGVVVPSFGEEEVNSSFDPDTILNNETSGEVDANLPL